MTLSSVSRQLSYGPFHWKVPPYMTIANKQQVVCHSWPIRIREWHPLGWPQRTYNEFVCHVHAWGRDIAMGGILLCPPKQIYLVVTSEF